MDDIKRNAADRLQQQVCVNDLARIGDGQVLYSSLCNEQGGMIDDLTLYRVAGDHFFLSPTPTRVDAVVAHLRDQAQGMNAYVTNMVPASGFISVQGPKAREIMGRLTDADLSTDALPYYSFVRTTVAELPAYVARTGYSGELGYEVFYSIEYGMYMWETVFAAGQDFGMVPCGLGALRSVRMEKRYPLYGLDLDDTTSPIEANLGWTVRFAKPAFNGRDALLRQRDQGVSRQLMTIEFPDLEFLPATGDPVSVDGRMAGKVTSADRGYFVGKSIALAYLSPEVAAAGTSVSITAKDGASKSGVVNQKAVYDPERERVRA
jgi:aminomethyltransferase